MNNNPILLIIPLFIFIWGILQSIFAEKFATFYRKTIKYEWRPNFRWKLKNK
jgi:hypothetical protein